MIKFKQMDTRLRKQNGKMCLKLWRKIIIKANEKLEQMMRQTNI